MAMASASVGGGQKPCELQDFRGSTWIQTPVCEHNDQIESFYFESFLWPIEQVWVLGFISLFLCFSFFFSR